MIGQFKLVFCLWKNCDSGGRGLGRPRRGDKRSRSPPLWKITSAISFHRNKHFDPHSPGNLVSQFSMEKTIGTLWDPIVYSMGKSVKRSRGQKNRCSCRIEENYWIHPFNIIFQLYQVEHSYIYLKNKETQWTEP